jgi:hypothetical protein
MKYAVIKVVNGHYSIHAEDLTADAARVSYFGLCQSLWNASDVLDACVMIVDTNLDRLGDYKEHIKHEQV